jgi:hypothetical protein
MNNIDAFLNRAFSEAAKSPILALCPCSKCKNKRMENKDTMGKHLVKNGFMPHYTRWVHHGEAHRIREKVVRQRVEAYDAEARVADMLDDAHQAQFTEGREMEEMEESTETFYAMLDSAWKPLHTRTTASQLDAIGRLLGLKSELNMSRDGFDKMLAVVATLLPLGHILPNSLYESQKLLRALKMSYDQIHACLNGCVLFRKEHKDAKYCPKRKSSRYVEADSSDGQKTQLKIPMKIIRHLLFLSRIQRLYMTEQSVKQMTWHKNDV